MKITHPATAFGVSLLFCSQVVAPATAQTSSSVYSVVVDTAPLDLKDVKSGDAITFASTSNDCVCCTISALRNEHRLEFSQVRADPYGDGSLGELTAGVKPRGLGTPASVKSSLYAAFSEPDVRSRVCFPVGRDNYRLTIGSVGAPPADPSSGIEARIQCASNALYGSYNLNGSEFNFLELHGLGGDLWGPPQTGNDGNVQVNVNLDAVAGNTTNPASPYAATFEAQLSQTSQYRQDFALHDRVTPDSWGTVKVCHDGAPGSVQGSVKRYKITSTNPLNFTLVGIEPLTRR